MYNTARLLDSYREASEDRAEFVSLSEDALALIVADGVGGRENGGNAAVRAVELTRESVNAANARELSDPHFWEQMLLWVDEAVSDDETCGETTLVALCLTPSRITRASVGDSEAWWISESGNVRVLTQGGRKPYLGRAMSIPVTFSLPTPPTGTLLAATDGLFKYTDVGQIREVVSRGASDLQVVAPPYAIWHAVLPACCTMTSPSCSHTWRRTHRRNTLRPRFGSESPEHPPARRTALRHFCRRAAAPA